MELNWKDLQGKKVHLILKNNYEYNGLINSVQDDEGGLVYIEMIDKFGKTIIFLSDEIKFLEVKE